MANLPSRKNLASQREGLFKHGLIFELPYTSIGAEEMYTIRMRYVSAMDKAVVEAMPADAQKQVFDGLKSIEKSQQGTQKDPNSLLEALSNNAEQVKAADLLFCAAAVRSVDGDENKTEPAVYMTEEDAEAHDAYFVEDLAAEDRLGFLMATIGGNQELARRLKLFRPESKSDVQDSAAGGVDESPSLHAVESV